MNLGYRKHFPFSGEPTYFKEQILNGIFDYPYTSISRYDNEGNTLPDLLIENQKVHSIREDPHNRWKYGMTIHHAYGIRTKNYDCFAESQCEGIQSIEIEYPEDREVFSFLVAECILTYDEYLYKRVRVNIGGCYVSERTVKELALNDGFSSLIDFFRWFDKPFTEKIIHWTDLRY